MTTTDDAARPPVAAADQVVSAVPFPRLVAVELRKTAASRSGRWLLVATGVLVVAVVAVAVVAADQEDVRSGDLLDAASAPLTLLLPLLAVLAVTTEWSQRTALITFTLEPRRTRVVLAKLSAVVAVGLLAVAATLVAAAVGVLAGGGSWALEGSDVRGLVLALVPAVVQAFAFGLLLRSTAAAIVVAYLVTPVWSTVLALSDRLEAAAPWLDLGAALTPVTSSGGVGAQQWAQLASAVVLWVLLPLGLGLLRLVRGEVEAD